MQEMVVKSEMLIVMQNVNPAARWVEGALGRYDCFVGLHHTVQLPFVLRNSKQNIPIALVKDEGSKFECVEKRLQYK